MRDSKRKVSHFGPGIAVALCVVLGGAPSTAHPGLDILIQEITRRIEKNPKDPVLYLRRCFYYRVHQEFEKALADAARAEALSPDLADVHFHRAYIFLDSRKFQASVREMDAFLKTGRPRSRAYTIRARALRGLGKLDAAVKDFWRSIELRPNPDIYKERGDCLVALGRTREAIENYEHGIKRLKRPIALVVYLVELLAEDEKYDEAIREIDRTIQRLPRADAWLLRRARILEKAGRPDEAAKSYRRVIDGIDTLPAGRRHARATQRTRRQASDALRRLESGSSPGKKVSPSGKTPLPKAGRLADAARARVVSEEKAVQREERKAP